MHEMPFKRVVLDIFVGKLDYLPAETESVLVAAFPLEFDADFCAAEFCPALEVVINCASLASGRSMPGLR